MKKEQIMFSGIKPSGLLHIGHYMGVISQWLNLQLDNSCIFAIADYHSITVRQEPEQLRENIINITKTYLAAGIDYQKAIIFQQSAVSEHTELAWVLNCCGTYMADLKKMTQFKDKAAGNQEAVSVGLFDYPVLMAADILLYDTAIVPVGEDQRQHVELARDIARRFNARFGDIFTVPQELVQSQGARIMSLQEPSKKMSKSDSQPNGCIFLSDEVSLAKKKIMRAVTDSGSEIIYDPVSRPAISNLLEIYAILGGRQIKRLEKDYAGSGYGQFKADLAEVVGKFLTDFQAKYEKISNDDVREILANGQARAAAIAQKKMAEVRRAIGVR